MWCSGDLGSLDAALSSIPLYSTSMHVCFHFYTVPPTSTPLPLAKSSSDWSAIPVFLSQSPICGRPMDQVSGIELAAALARLRTPRGTRGVYCLKWQPTNLGLLV